MDTKHIGSRMIDLLERPSSSKGLGMRAGQGLGPIYAGMFIPADDSPHDDAEGEDICSLAALACISYIKTASGDGMFGFACIPCCHAASRCSI
jgi:hypothetical protein